LARTAQEVAETLTRHDVSFSPIYTIADIFDDPHFAARESIVGVQDRDFGSVQMQNVVPRFSASPGCVWRTGPSLGEHNEEIYRDALGLSQHQLDALRVQGVI
jgi:crotonobetainyl-CoA:carnitine CoA-transferase CaiB-like acyl-CoA transferase